MSSLASLRLAEPMTVSLQVTVRELVRGNTMTFFANVWTCCILD